MWKFGKHIFIAFPFLLLMVSKSDAQNKVYHHNVAWGRLVFTDTLNARTRWELYLQQRTQDDQNGGANLFNERQFTSYWLWMHYQATKNIKLSASPIGYFDSKVLIVKPSDADQQGIREFRFSIRAEQETKYRFLNVYNRYNLEYRLRDMKNENVFKPNWRFRYMLRFEKPIKIGSKTVTLIANDELMIQFGGTVKNNPNVFDQNRIYAGFAFELVRNVKLNLGYLYTVQQRPSGFEFDRINTFWGILTFDNLFSQWKR